MAKAAEVAKVVPRSREKRTWGSDRSLCCEEEEDLQGAEWNRGRSSVRSCRLFTLSVRQAGESSHYPHKGLAKRRHRY
jgi:hypothetical protein